MSATTEDRRPRGFVPIGGFFIFGATMAAYAAITLLFPGTFLDALWVLNKQGHDGLAASGRTGALAFLILCTMLAMAAVGWFRRRRWGWILGITIIAINMAGDLGQVAFGEKWKGTVGVVIAGLLLVYMTRSAVRSYFRSRSSRAGETPDPSLRLG